MTIGTRLKGERMRLEMTQAALVEKVGVRKHTQINYESGKCFPNADYLAKLAESGMDVLYVITGERNPDMPGATLLSTKQQALITNYDAATEENKKLIEGVARLAMLRGK